MRRKVSFVPATSGTPSSESTTQMFGMRPPLTPEYYRAQGLAPSSQAQMQDFIETLDPDSSGYVTYPHFLALCAIQLRSKTDESRDEEVQTAFQLFNSAGSDPQGQPVIRLHDLRTVAKTLREDVSDDVLKAMILEANNGKGVNSGVNLEDFRAIMTRAGVFQ